MQGHNSVIMHDFLRGTGGFLFGVIRKLVVKFRNDMSRTVVVIAAEKNNNNNNNNNNQTKYIKVFPLEKGKTLITIPEVNLNEHRH